MNTPNWIDARHSQPIGESTAHFSVSVIGVIDDPNYRMNGDAPFVDVVSYWPAEKRWTITHQCRADDFADDYPCRVTHWMPLPALPSE